MKSRIGNLRYPIAAALFAAGLLVAPCAAQDVSMELIGAGPANLGGAYVGPYTALINGVSTPVICDDFKDETYFYETWQATQSTLSSQTNPLLYERGAWLVLQMLNPANSNSVGVIQYALWQLFDPSGSPAPFSYLGSSDRAAAQSWLNEALAEGSTVRFTAAELAQFSNFVVYQPVAGTDKCGAGPCPTAPPQEFLALDAPEPIALPVLLLDLLALAGVVLFVRKREVRAAS